MATTSKDVKQALLVVQALQDIGAIDPAHPRYGDYVKAQMSYHDLKREYHDDRGEDALYQKHSRLLDEWFNRLRRYEKEVV